MGEVVEIDVARRIVRLSDGEVPYDTLIVATGATHHYFGHDEWEPLAPGLKTIEDATEIRRADPARVRDGRARDRRARARRAWLTFVVVGAGPTGVELAGALGEIANDTLRHDFRSIDPRDARILLVEGRRSRLAAVSAGPVGGGPPLVDAAGRDRPPEDERHGDRARRRDRHGRTGGRSASARAPCCGRRACRRRRWRASSRAPPARALDRAGRIHVLPDLSLPGHPEIVVIGDMAHVEQDGAMLPGVAPVAMAEGRYAAQRVDCRASPAARIRRSATTTRARWRRSAASAAVADLGCDPLRRASSPGSRGCSSTCSTWWSSRTACSSSSSGRVMYFTFNRGARLITGADPLPLPLKEGHADKAAPS